jgi:hypothetical protein
LLGLLRLARVEWFKPGFNPGLPFQAFFEIIRRIMPTTDTIKKAAIAGGSGAAVGGGVATGSLAAVGAFGTASTGTAISTLSGAAATNATLAWFGGGAVAAGGWGITWGTVVLTGGSTLIALGAAYGLYCLLR